MFSAGASNYADSVDSTMLYIVGISLLFLVGITVAMVWFVIRYSRKRNPKASQIEGNMLLEITWIVIPVILVMSMFYYSYSDFYKNRERSDSEITIKATGRMWQWSFEYENGINADTLYLPVNTVTTIRVTSLDVLHSFYLPAFRIKEDAVPQKDTYIIIEPRELGSYDIACAEYCGLNHSYMYSKLNVVTKPEYEQWLATKK